eukprot:SAG31_NODE_150_length_22290_cov_5.975801_29_plen_106_part_00
MWPDDRVYLNVTATAAEMVRRSGLGLRYSVAADITLMYETTLWNGSLTSMTSPRPYYQALMDQVDEVLLMDYGQTTAQLIPINPNQSQSVPINPNQSQSIPTNPN